MSRDVPYGHRRRRRRDAPDREWLAQKSRRGRRCFSAPGGDLNLNRNPSGSNRRDRRLRSKSASPQPLTWFSVVGMMSGVCGSIVAGVLACLASNSNQSGLPARAAGDIIEIGDGWPRKENTLTRTHREIDHELHCPPLSLSLSLSRRPFSLPFVEFSLLYRFHSRYSPEHAAVTPTLGTTCATRRRSKILRNLSRDRVEKCRRDRETRNVSPHLESMRGTDGSGRCSCASERRRVPPSAAERRRRRPNGCHPPRVRVPRYPPTRRFGNVSSFRLFFAYLIHLLEAYCLKNKCEAKL